MKIIISNIFIVSLSLLFISGCELTSPSSPPENNLLDGFVNGLSQEQQGQFLRGDIAFNAEVFTSETGLGPIFVANSCGSCHVGDGKGHPFISFIRFGQSDTLGNKYLSQGGPQLQHRAIPGYLPETLPPSASFTRLLAPAVTGLGYLDAVSDEDIINMADPDDVDGDGISGRINWNFIPDYVEVRPNSISQNGKYITRFGKKSAAYDLLHQTSRAYNQDIGITSIFEPIDVYSGKPIDPEISTQTLLDVVFYLKSLKAPIPRKQEDQFVISGEQIFQQIGCTSCHKPTLTTGYSPFEFLAYKTIHPYTDLLLHDMGPELDDGYTEGFALTSEWRTPPLWGLGLSKKSQGGNYFLMHDGRATTIDQAILFHEGEGHASKISYIQLPGNDKGKLIRFLESL